MARRDHEDNPDRWLVSYADFITLMFAFFVVLFATSEQDAQKMQEFQESVKKYLIKYGAFGGSGDEVNQGQVYNSPIAPPIETFPAKQKDNDETQKVVETKIEEQISEKDLEGTILDISGDPAGVRISLRAGALFPEGSAHFKGSAIPFLTTLGKILKESGRRIFVENHSASTPFKSEAYASNWELTSARSAKLARYMIQVHKLRGDRLAALGYGDSRPLFDAGKKDEASKNERVEFLLVTDDVPL